MSVRYVDSSALLKRVVVEDESSALRRLLAGADERGDLLVASSLAWLEVWRSLRRSGVASVAGEVRRATAGIAEFPMTNDVLVRARAAGGHTLRSLHAIHLASALDVEADELVTYDVRLATAAESAGIAAVAPRDG